MEEPPSATPDWVETSGTGYGPPPTTDQNPYKVGATSEWARRPLAWLRTLPVGPAPRRRPTPTDPAGGGPWTPTLTLSQGTRQGGRPLCPLRGSKCTRRRTPSQFRTRGPKPPSPSPEPPQGDEPPDHSRSPQGDSTSRRTGSRSRHLKHQSRESVGPYALGREETLGCQTPSQRRPKSTTSPPHATNLRPSTPRDLDDAPGPRVAHGEP